MALTSEEQEALVERVTAYVGAGDGPVDAAHVGACVGEAQALVGAFVGQCAVPPKVLERATVEVAAELFHRRQAPSGIVMAAVLEGGGGPPSRVARDPMVAAYPLLVPFTGPGLA